MIRPNFPSHWDKASVIRYFRGAKIFADISRNADVKDVTVIFEGKPLEGGLLTDICEGRDYRLSVLLPFCAKLNHEINNKRTVD